MHSKCTSTEDREQHEKEEYFIPKSSPPSSLSKGRSSKEQRLKPDMSALGRYREEKCEGQENVKMTNLYSGSCSWLHPPTFLREDYPSRLSHAPPLACDMWEEVTQTTLSWNWKSHFVVLFALFLVPQVRKRTAPSAWAWEWVRHGTQQEPSHSLHDTAFKGLLNEKWVFAVVSY